MPISFLPMEEKQIHGGEFDLENNQKGKGKAAYSSYIQMVSIPTYSGP